MRCLIVLPCFNEETNVKPLVHSIDHVLKPEIPYKIIAVNDGSYDRTSEILKDLSSDYPVEVLHHSANMGLGASLRTGLLAAAEEAFDEDFVVIMDSDNTHDPKHIVGMLAAGKKAEVVVGSRYVKGGCQLNVPIHRVFLSKIINLFASRLLQLPVHDATSGFRCYRGLLVKRLRKTFRSNIIVAKGFEASMELLLKAINAGSRVTEVPILLDYGKKNGKSKMHLFSTIAKYLILLFRFKRLRCTHR